MNVSASVALGSVVTIVGPPAGSVVVTGTNDGVRG